MDTFGSGVVGMVEANASLITGTEGVEETDNLLLASAGMSNRCDSGSFCRRISALVGELSNDMANTIFRSKNATPTQRTTMMTRNARAVTIRCDLNPSLLLDVVDADDSSSPPRA